MKIDYVIIGSGLSGATIAEILANKYNKLILIIEKRSHIAGNCFDKYNNDGIIIQQYGPHIFHTDDTVVWNYLSRFTEWNNYVHRVLANVIGMEVPFPINIETLEILYGEKFTFEQFNLFLSSKKIYTKEVSNAKEVIVSNAGEELYDLFFKNYSKKQWGIYPDELNAEVTTRVPIRYNRDGRYFTDRYQGIPKYGYTQMVENMLKSSNIRILLNTNYKDVLQDLSYQGIIYTGPIDYYFDYLYGHLPYRSLDFKMQTIDTEWHQNAAVINYPNEYDHTRITEFKYFYSQKNQKTTICYEYPKGTGEPYYPIPCKSSIELYKKYKKEAEKFDNVFFTGRLAEYRYLNMDQVVCRSMKLAEKICS